MKVIVNEGTWIYLFVFIFDTTNKTEVRFTMQSQN